MTPTVDLLVESIEKPSYFDKIESYLVDLVATFGKKNWEMSLTLCDNEYIAQLNQEYRGKEGPTDVLTFVMEEGDGFPTDSSLPLAVGDIVVSLEKVLENSQEFGITFDEELKRVILHGILHLKGMTHEGYDWNEGMLKEQEISLKKYKDIRFTE